MTYVPQHRERLVAAAAEQVAARSRVRRPRWRGVSAPVLAVLLAALVPAVVVAATIVVRHATPPDRYEPGDPAPAIDRHPGSDAGRPPAPALLRSFRVLRRPERPGDRFGPGEDIGASPYFANQIRRVEVRDPLRGPGRAVPSVVRVAGAPDGAVCLLVRTPPPAGDHGAYGPVSTCGQPGDAATGRIVFTHAMALYGLVPDGVRRVGVTLLDGRGSVLPVVDDVFSARLPAPVRRLSFRGPAGRVTRTLSR